MFKYKQVIVAREDLEMSSGKLAVQVAHGSIGAVEEARHKKPEWVSEWIKEKQKKVVVQVPSEEDLHDLNKKANELGLPTKLVQDAGLTELAPNTPTVLGVGPGPNELVDKVTGNLPLW